MMAEVGKYFSSNQGNLNYRLVARNELCCSFGNDCFILFQIFKERGCSHGQNEQTMNDGSDRLLYHHRSHSTHSNLVLQKDLIYAHLVPTEQQQKEVVEAHFGPSYLYIYFKFYIHYTKAIPLQILYPSHSFSKSKRKRSDFGYCRIFIKNNYKPMEQTDRNFIDDMTKMIIRPHRDIYTLQKLGSPRTTQALPR